MASYHVATFPPSPPRSRVFLMEFRVSFALQLRQAGGWFRRLRITAGGHGRTLFQDDFLASADGQVSY